MSVSENSFDELIYFENKIVNSSWPLITVITPFFNNSNLMETVYSVLEQDYPNIEYIIADDCSKINHSKSLLLQGLLETLNLTNFLSIRVQRQRNNVGTVKNLNDAIKQSKGKYIFILSADDLFYNKHVLKEWTQFLISEKALISTAKRLICKINKKNMQCIRPLRKEISNMTNLNPSELYLTLKYDNYISGCCTAYSKKCFEQYGYFDESYKLLEDHPMILHLLKQHVKIAFWDKIAIYYMTGGVSAQENINEVFEQDVETLLKHEACYNGDDISKIINAHRKEKQKTIQFYQYWNQKKFLKASRCDMQKTVKEILKPR